MAAKKKKSELSFDVEKANALLNELGGLLVEDGAYEGHDWAGISLVVEFDDDAVSLSGYAYPEGKPHIAVVPENPEVFDVVEALRDVMAADGKGAWAGALVRITQPGPEIEMEFDYDGGQWEVGAEALRPESVAGPKAKAPAKKKAPAKAKKAAPKKKSKTKR